MTCPYIKIGNSLSANSAEHFWHFLCVRTERVSDFYVRACHNLDTASLHSTPSNPKQNCMENHPKKYLLEIQRFGSPGFGLKLSVRMGSWPLNFRPNSVEPNFWISIQNFGLVPHTILLGIRGVPKFLVNWPTQKYMQLKSVTRPSGFTLVKNHSGELTAECKYLFGNSFCHL